MTATTGVTDVCNVYMPAALTEADPYAWNRADTSNPARFWCPTSPQDRSHRLVRERPT